MGWKTVAICDFCWVEEEGARQPVRLVDTHHDTCYRCGAPTQGIYTRANVTLTPDGAA